LSTISLDAILPILLKILLATW